MIVLTPRSPGSNDICRSRMPSVTKRMRVAVGHAGFKADLVANRLPERRTDFLGHALGQEAGREPPRLQHDHLPVAQQAVAQQHLRKLRRFTRPGRRLHNEADPAPHRSDDGGLQIINGQIVGRHQVKMQRRAGGDKSSRRPASQIA